MINEKYSNIKRVAILALGLLGSYLPSTYALDNTSTNTSPKVGFRPAISRDSRSGGAYRVLSDLEKRDIRQGKAQKKSVREITWEYLDAHPVTAGFDSSTSGSSKSGLGIGARTDDSGRLECTIYYSASSWKELANGLAMPFTIYRQNNATGKTETLPAYAHPIRSGGALSPEWGLIASGINGIGSLCGAKDELVYNPFTDRPQLTWGVFFDQAAAAAAVYALSSKGGSSGKNSTETTSTKPSNPVNPNPSPTPNPTPNPKPNPPVQNDGSGHPVDPMATPVQPNQGDGAGSPTN